jgi:WD40 repeat protein
LYSIQQQQQQINFKLIQTFPQEHSSHEITSLIHLNENTLISASGSSHSYSDSSNVIVIWTKSPKSSSSSFFEPIQRITRKEAGGDIYKLVLITQKKEEEEEEFASCSYSDDLIIIWRRGKGGKGGKGEGEFKIKQKITNVKDVSTLLYISLTNELISGSSSLSSPSLLQIWSSSSYDFVQRQKIQTSSGIESLCQINGNDSKRIEFASGQRNGQIMIWSKQQQTNESEYSSIRTLQPFNKGGVTDLIFINDNGFLIACCENENKIKIFKGEKEEKELKHKEVRSLIPMSNGQFASGGYDQCLFGRLLFLLHEIVFL